MTGTVADGVFFTEADAEPYRISATRIAVKISRQNATLPKVKQQLAARVKQVGGNALVDFTYGQKRNLFGWDDVAWHGSGFAARLPSAISST